MFDFQRMIFISPGFYLDLRFRAVHGSSEKTFFVTAIDRNGKELSFNVKAAGKGMWKIVNAPRVPDLLLAKEEEISFVITEYENSVAA